MFYYLIQRCCKSVKIFLVQKDFMAFVTKTVILACAFGNSDKKVFTACFTNIQEIGAAFASTYFFGEYAFVLLAVKIATIATITTVIPISITIAWTISAAATAKTWTVTASVVTATTKTWTVTTSVIAVATATKSWTVTTAITTAIIAITTAIVAVAAAVIAISVTWAVTASFVITVSPAKFPEFHCI
jgi:hypothetical protein